MTEQRKWNWSQEPEEFETEEELVAELTPVEMNEDDEHALEVLSEFGY